MRRWLIVLALALLTLAGSLRPTYAQEVGPAALAETARARLAAAQIALTSDPEAARAALGVAEAAYADLAPDLALVAPGVSGRAEAALAAAAQALAGADAAALAAARADFWAALLTGGYTAVTTAIERGDVGTARRWLALREFRHATRFSRPGADATLAVRDLAAGSVTSDAALAAVRADMLDTYQARLGEALADLDAADAHGFAARRAEAATLAGGYFGILAPAYAEQRGPAAVESAQAALAGLRAAALAGLPLTTARAAVDHSLEGFRAAPLAPAEQARRAGQLLRFLSLVPVEYARGVRAGRVTIDLEIREASTFHAGAMAAFADLRDTLAERDRPATLRATALFASLEAQLAAAAAHHEPAPDPDQLRADVEQLTEIFGTLMPLEWRQSAGAADFDVIAAALDQMERAVSEGHYDLAESARLEAYAILESGPEAKLIVFAPQYKAPIEDLFWYGQGDQQGLAFLIERGAPTAQVAASRRALDTQLAAAEQALSGNSAPAAVATNAAVIVFREGLEAVLILASLLGSFKIGAQRRFRQPLWLGTGLAFLASMLTWLLARSMLTALARYGERLEAVVSLVAIAVLLLITNWFFHDVYWKDWMANFHQQKRRLIGGAAGQWLGLVLLGFSSVYREGFETVLFLQALVLEAGPATVLGGVAAGLSLTLLVGLAVFVLQTRLPHKKMLIATGILIGVVLLQLVGNTAHVLQVVGWLPLHPIRWLQLPYWSGFWFGLYATWEGLLLQFAAAIFVIGSYFLAEYIQRRARSAPTAQPAIG